MDLAENQAAISFVIPHKGREEMLRQTLLSIAAQDFERNQIEVFVVTQNKKLDASTLPAPAQLNVTVVFRPETDTIAKLRNEGARLSRSNYLAFLDADIEIAPNWIESMLRELSAKSGRVLVSSVQGCDSQAPSLEKIRTALSRIAANSAVEFLPGANLLLRRETFFAVDGFPEHLVTCEDYFFSDKVNQIGGLYQSSESEFIHLGEDKSYAQMFKKEIWRAQSNLTSIQGRKFSLRELPSLLVPVWIFLFTVLVAFSAASGDLGSSLVLFMLGSIPIFLYALRLFRIADPVIPFFSIVKFYSVYFPARVIGMFKGLSKLVWS